MQVYSSMQNLLEDHDDIQRTSAVAPMRLNLRQSWTFSTTDNPQSVPQTSISIVASGLSNRTLQAGNFFDMISPTILITKFRFKLLQFLLLKTIAKVLAVRDTYFFSTSEHVNSSSSGDAKQVACMGIILVTKRDLGAALLESLFISDKIV
mmetsp:Transcript_2977/g.7028  ORF Transcript_2977/g.7028 Transcript_2977/m.7028 type:complete len:151 (-) Transcript_2977:842-1294(-)